MNVDHRSRAEPQESRPNSVVVAPFRHLRRDLFEVTSLLDAELAEAVPSDLGRVWVHRDDSVFPRRLRKFGTWHPTEGRLLRALLRPGMTALDVGAMVGYFSRLLGQAVGPTGRVVALEPEPRNYGLLCANIWEAGLLNVEPIQAAADRTTREVAISRSETNFGDHRAFPMEGRTTTVGVQAVRIDDLLRPEVEVDVVKIDAQGMDHAVVEGMEGTIARRRPTVLVEFWPAGIAEFGDDPGEVLRLYRSMGFAIADAGQQNRRLAAADNAAFVETVAASQPPNANLVLHAADLDLSTAQ